MDSYIPTFLLDKPLYDSIKDSAEETLLWSKAQQMAFQTLKANLLSAAALAFPNLEKTFTLYM